MILIKIYLFKCRRKKKCIRYLDNSDNINESEGDNRGSSIGSVEAPTPDSKSTNESDHDNVMSSAELSMSSPPVPNSDYILTHHMPSHHISSHMNSNDITTRVNSSTSLAIACPPRNSPIGPNNPLSIEQLTRPYKQTLHTHILTPNNSCIVSSVPSSVVNTSHDQMSLPQLALPPSTDSSTTSAPLLSVA